MLLNLSLDLTVALCLACSCSVKTDRTECPCLLGVELSGGRESLADVTVWNSQTNSGTEEARMIGDTAHFELLVPRSPLTFAAWNGVHACKLDGLRLTIPVGEQMDELYACCCEVDASGETAGVRASLCKQFAYLHVNVVDTRPDEYPFYFRVRGDVCGVNLCSLEPLNGEFSVTAHPVVGLYHRFCIPRQNDSSLRLDFLYESDPSGKNPAGGIHLGEYLEGIGYDWQAENLDDIYLDIDRVLAEISITVKDWETVLLCEDML